MARNKKSVISLLSNLKFDPNENPYRFALDTKNPLYTFTRAQEILAEAQNDVTKLNEAVKYIVLTKILLAESNGATQTEGKART